MGVGIGICGLSFGGLAVSEIFSELGDRGRKLAEEGFFLQSTNTACASALVFESMRLGDQESAERILRDLMRNNLKRAERYADDLGERPTPATVSLLRTAAAVSETYGLTEEGELARTVLEKVAPGDMPKPADGE